jgi:hypothetical protein
MSTLYDTWMEKKATAQSANLSAEDEVILKYASYANELLQEAVERGDIPGNTYNQDDVAELTSKLIARDQAVYEKQAELEKVANLEKIAELETAGAIVADAFVERLKEYGFNL